MLQYVNLLNSLGGYGGGETPLTIPNREVKPTSADGTAKPGGRVGRRQPYNTKAIRKGSLLWF